MGVLMNWSSVGDWITGNAGTGAALVGSLLTGNVPGAIAAGVSLVSGATGTNNPEHALMELQSNPDALVELRKLANEEKHSIRKHLEEMTRLDLEDEQKSHRETQDTIRAGDKAEDRFVRWTRPGQSWCMMGASVFYVFKIESPDVMILGILLTIPFAYAGLRQVGKGIDSFKRK